MTPESPGWLPERKWTDLRVAPLISLFDQWVLVAQGGGVVGGGYATIDGLASRWSVLGGEWEIDDTNGVQVIAVDKSAHHAVRTSLLGMYEAILDLSTDLRRLAGQGGVR